MFSQRYRDAGKKSEIINSFLLVCICIYDDDGNAAIIIA